MKTPRKPNGHVVFLESDARPTGVQLKKAA